MNIAKLTDQAGSYTSVINGNTCFTYEQLQKFVDIVRAEAFEEAAKWCEAKQSYSAMHANTEFAAAIRARGEK